MAGKGQMGTGNRALRRAVALALALACALVLAACAAQGENADAEAETEAEAPPAWPVPEVQTLYLGHSLFGMDTTSGLDEVTVETQIPLGKLAEGPARSFVVGQLPALLVAELLARYPGFDLTFAGWQAELTFADAGRTAGQLLLTYRIGDMIDTNKTIRCTVESETITSVTFTNILAQANEPVLIARALHFAAVTQQEQHRLRDNERVLSEAATYLYYYNVDKLTYLYTLVFEETVDDVTIVINTERCAYVIP